MTSTFRNKCRDINHALYPCKRLWMYTGKKILKQKAEKDFHRCTPTNVYYLYNFIRS